MSDRSDTPAPSPRPEDPMDPARAQANLQAPWRLTYLESLSEAERRPAKAGVSGSFLRGYWLTPEADEANHVLVRTDRGMVLLNRYPYANGHLLVALGEARPSLLDYGADDRAALWRLTDAAAALLLETLDPQGINIGINQGRAAGAGVPEHLHVHLVPRWGGDTNFISVVGQVRVMPSSLEVMAARFRQAWSRIESAWTGTL